MKNQLATNYKITRNDILFCIEGYNILKNQTTLCESFPEIVKSSHFAESIGCEIIDIIDSYDVRHLAPVLIEASKKSPEFFEKEQKLMVLVILLLTKHSSKQSALDIIQPLFQHLVDEHIIQSIPDWVKDLANPYAYKNLYKQVKNEYFFGSRWELKKELNDQSTALLKRSNQISQKNLTDYLDQHPEINTVYALIGMAHLPLLMESNVGEVIAKPTIASKIPEWALLKHKDFCEMKLNYPNRQIHIYLYGGVHHTTTACNQMQKDLCKSGLLTKPEHFYHRVFHLFANHKKSQAVAQQHNANCSSHRVCVN